jgi:hypothetical protein
MFLALTHGFLGDLTGDLISVETVDLVPSTPVPLSVFIYSIVGLEPTSSPFLQRTRFIGTHQTVLLSSRSYIE